MILVKHNCGKVTSVVHATDGVIIVDSRYTIAQAMVALAKVYVLENIAWCDTDFEANLNIEMLEALLKNKKTMLSFGEESFLSKQIGYIDESPFINVQKNVRYPTWLMSETAGIMSAEALNVFQNTVVVDSTFGYFLCSISKLGMPNGLLCYSEPLLFKNTIQFAKKDKINLKLLFRFVKQHFKKRLLLLLFFNLFVYENRVPFSAVFQSLFFKKMCTSQLHFCDSLLGEAIKIPLDYDVLIPTIGRKTYLYDFLKDLNQQTILPNKVIIIEQNPDQNTGSELNFLTSDVWNFEIIHLFTHQTGACNARTMGIAQTQSYWTFMADDDISINADFSENVFQKLAISQTKVATINCHLKNEKQIYKRIFQWNTFGSGCSFVTTSELKKCTFKQGFEHGFGEDADFGMQLRKAGNDVLYFPSPKILHHKAAIGGFRTKQKLAWSADLVQPKPSPTVMLYQMLHNTSEQILGYKTILFFKFYKKQTRKNPIRYYNFFQKQWNQSVFWANTLKQKL